jgi:hypothetical protein
MADLITKILQPATTYDLMSLAEIKLVLNIATTDTSSDAELAQLITRFSDVVSVTCHRVFAKETVAETWRCIQSNRVFLTHFPALITDIQSVECPRGTFLDSTGWEFEEQSGKLELQVGMSDPVVVTYIGGYDLPDAAPQALKQATELMILEYRAILARLEMGGVRSISHKEARVMFFDPLAFLNKMGGLGWGTANALLMRYTRLEC